MRRFNIVHLRGEGLEVKLRCRGLGVVPILHPLHFQLELKTLRAVGQVCAGHAKLLKLYATVRQVIVREERAGDSISVDSI